MWCRTFLLHSPPRGEHDHLAPPAGAGPREYDRPPPNPETRPGPTERSEYRGTAHTGTAITPADAPLVWWPHGLLGAPHLHTLRDVLPHVITETACHAGRLDAARELLDGRRRLVLT
ncbi:DUF664 domain-containing protein [Streptomyces sp. WP-1]|uniref:mycothiol transferase n=1 Tax=Streptomyces sp. WP-1 TaxID=3041497 RepID=UPI00351AEC30